MKVWVFLILLYFGFSSAAPVDEDALKELLESVPQDERESFLKDQIYLGYKLKKEKNNEFSNIPVSEDVTISIYEYYLINKMITSLQDLTLRDIICFPDGTCIDPDDPGVRP